MTASAQDCLDLVQEPPAHVRSTARWYHAGIVGAGAVPLLGRLWHQECAALEKEATEV